jgi:hypothetical protein
MRSGARARFSPRVLSYTVSHSCRELANGHGVGGVSNRLPHASVGGAWQNEVVVGALAGPPIDRWTIGSLLVKDGYTDDGELELVALMHKRDDGWFWAEYDSEGDPDYSGHPDVCIDCHDGAEADGVSATGSPRPLLAPTTIACGILATCTPGL